MHQQHKFRYVAADDLQLLELPYGDGSLSMVVLLPQNNGGLKELRDKAVDCQPSKNGRRALKDRKM